MALAQGADAAVRVVVIDKGGLVAREAARTGTAPLAVGEMIEAVDRTQIHSLRHLEALLLQAAADKVRLRIKAAGPEGAVREIVLPRP